MSFLTAPIGALFDVVNGATPKSDSPELWDGEIPWVTPADIGRLTDDTINAGEKSVTAEGLASCGTRLVPAGSIILSIRAPIGHLAIAGNSLCFNQGCRGLVPREGMDTRFAFWALTAAKPALERSGQGTTFMELSRGKLRSVRIHHPDLPTQKRIAAFLDREAARIDALIEKKQRFSTLILAREEASFLSAVTGRQLAGARNPSGVDWIGDLPDGWLAPKFTHVARQETGHTPSRKEPGYWVPEECVIPWVSLADVWQLRSGEEVYLHDTAEKVSEVGLMNSSARLLPKDTVILSRTASVGFAGIMGQPMATTQDFAAWICGPSLRPKYLYYVLRAMRSEFRRLMMGSTHQTIYMPDIRAFRTPLPPLHVQDQIIAQLDGSLSKYRLVNGKLHASIDRLREYRAALITAAVTGQIDVTSFQSKGEGDRTLDRIEAEMT